MWSDRTKLVLSITGIFVTLILVIAVAYSMDTVVGYKKIVNPDNNTIMYEKLYETTRLYRNIQEIGVMMCVNDLMSFLFEYSISRAFIVTCMILLFAWASVEAVEAP